jgi:hypothetical protein
MAVSKTHIGSTSCLLFSSCLSVGIGLIVSGGNGLCAIGTVQPCLWSSVTILLWQSERLLS